MAANFILHILAFISHATDHLLSLFLESKLLYDILFHVIYYYYLF